ncbi:terminase large subunit [Synechococcus phage ACG-2014b]|uniref:Terminase large subunit n=2 Tax=Synechococcus phage ACG-2014b TaxID=1493508 RepID=A0A0E3FZ54_9CAUD|nr:terminase large subunit [Synechococcus phage ACG-2014b]YP_009779734.1 terminase large subunit [Synechococcus phage ACG-2014b]YP_009779951.1 terminase large subunit [Synechococcus phage ACG-2014b]AIX17328.1 terminase large subunit [Synechococcus phage ACG-2014b]AIX17543.1 terminase large subunit [Synechococcus phage ACG-2014b]AIX17759.1 terminase large subunit [Synechococcus phage ACG-2014b]AIX17976.1 terminase large subunit [Synechococcus phage ACG-2014b]AIX18191.1 terminase large subunit
MSTTEQYLGNPNLKKANVATEFSPEEVQEYLKCADDPVYFIQTYIKIVSLDKGLIPFDMYDFQVDMTRKFHDNRFNIAKLPRQSGKSTIVTSYLLWYVLFNANVNVAILANKAATSREMLQRLQLSYENLPKWLQQGILQWNRGSLELENGSKIMAASTSSSAVRGMSFNVIFLDEFAFVPNHIADQFFSSVYPTISSGKSTKVIIISTPHGMNMFYKLWHDSERGKNEYIPTEVHWSAVPGRDTAWKEQTIKNTSEQQFKVEFECEFLGSVDTLISPSKLRTMPYIDPIAQNKGLAIYKRVEPEHNYIITVDVARGTSQDYSAFCVMDTTTVPYELVARYRNNEIKPIIFPNVIIDVARNYNYAYILCEVNDIGGQVADIIQFDLEYENLLMVAMRGRAGQQLGQGFSGKKTQLGVKMSSAVKQVGCSNLKALIEEDKLIIPDYETIAELTTFIVKGQSFAAEDGCNDDLAMCLVIFAWMAMQEYFKQMHDNDIRQRIYDDQRENIEQDMAPFGFMSDGLEDDHIIDAQGEVWQVAEYGDKSYMWEFR